MTFPWMFQTLEVMAGVRPSSHARETAEDIHQTYPRPSSIGRASSATSSTGPGRRVLAAPGAGPIALRSAARHAGGIAHAGIEARFGPAGDSVARLLRFAATPEFAANSQGWSAYAGASVRAVGHNELLSRNYDPSGGDLDRENVVTRISGGVAWIATWGAVTFDVAQDSREFSQQRTPQRFGSLTVSVTF
jgi:hypothetical protein